MLQSFPELYLKITEIKKFSKTFRICLRLNLALIKKSATVQLSIQSSFFTKTLDQPDFSPLSEIATEMRS